MVGFQRAGMGKNKKDIGIPPLMLDFGLKGERSENLKNLYHLSEMADFEFSFCF